MRKVGKTIKITEKSQFEEILENSEYFHDWSILTIELLRSDEFFPIRYSAKVKLIDKYKRNIYNIVEIYMDYINELQLKDLYESNDEISEININTDSDGFFRIFSDDHFNFIAKGIEFSFYNKLE